MIDSPKSLWIVIIIIVVVVIIETNGSESHCQEL